MKLTEKQEKFVQEIIKGKSQREAYKYAYDAKKMSDSAIDVNASKLLKNTKVALRLNELRDRLVKEAEDECIVSAKDVLKELAHIAFDDIKNYLRFYSDESGNIKMEVKDSETIDTRSISEVSLGKDGQFKFKMYCKDNALVQIGRHLGMFSDNVNIGNKDGKPFETKNSNDLSKLSVEELKQIESILAKTD